MDRIKIRFSRPRFVHKGNVTICMMNYSVPELDIYSRVKAIAKCREGDNYSDYIGERISQARAEIAARNGVKEIVTEELRRTEMYKYSIEKLIEDIKIFNSHDREAILRFLSEE